MEDTWNGIHAFQVFDGSIPASQARSSADRYVAVWGSWHPSPWLSGNPNINTSYYLPFSTDGPNSGHNLTWFKTNHPSWILYRCDKKTPAWVDGLPNVPLDVSNPAVVNYQMTTFGGFAESNGYGGIAADVLNFGNSGRGCYVNVNGAWVRKFSGDSPDPQWTTAVQNWAGLAATYLHGLPRPMALIGNHIASYNPVGDADERRIIAHLDMLLDESAFSDYGHSYANDRKFNNTVGWMQYAQTLGKGYLVIDEWQSVGAAELSWSIATYLMGKNHASALFVSGIQSYGVEHWHSEYNAAVGTPCAAMYPTQNVYFRKFTKGLAIVNTSASARQTVRLPAHTYTNLYGSRVSSPLTIQPHSGMTLLTTDGCS